MADERRRVAVILYPGFDELDAIGPYEVLRMASDERELDVELIRFDGEPQIVASHGAVLSPRGSLNGDGSPLDGDLDLVVVPGGGWARRQGAFIEAERGAIPSALRALHAAGTTIASVCTGAMLLAAAGIVKGRPAITHQVAVPALEEAGAEIVQARVVDDGDILTSGGVTSGIDLGLWLVERMWDRELADVIASRLEHHRDDDVFRGPNYSPAIGPNGSIN